MAPFLSSVPCTARWCFWTKVIDLSRLESKIARRRFDNSCRGKPSQELKSVLERSDPFSREVGSQCQSFSTNELHLGSSLLELEVNCSIVSVYWLKVCRNGEQKSRVRDCLGSCCWFQWLNTRTQMFDRHFDHRLNLGIVTCHFLKKKKNERRRSSFVWTYECIEVDGRLFVIDCNQQLQSIFR